MPQNQIKTSEAKSENLSPHEVLNLSIRRTRISSDFISALSPISQRFRVQRHYKFADIYELVSTP